MMRHDLKWIPLVMLAACSSPTENNANSVVDPGQSQCERDDAKDPATAASLAVGEAMEGYVCPVEDEDWFKLNVPVGSALFGIELSLSAPLSAVEPSYALWSVDGAGEPDIVVAQPPSTGIGQALNFTHCVDPGDYFLVVRDSGNDAEDFRHPYTLSTVTKADPDTNEPNAKAAPKPAQIGTAVTGYVACRADEDWYSISVPDGQLLSIELTSAIATYEPTVRVFDTAGELIVEEINASGSVAETNIQRFEVLPAAGDYFVVVSDDNNEDADPNVPYTLTVNLVSDEDPNEPNNHPDEATPLAASAVTCAAAWTTMTTTGTIGSPGDDDWFVLPLSGCTNGIIEATVELQAGGTAQDKWDLAAEVQATVTMVKGHAQSPCSRDEDCNSLQAACEEDLECSGLFETCLNDGLCAGATVCLPGGVCGANQSQRRYYCPPRLAECMPNATTPPRPNGATMSAPIKGESVVYLRVGDFQGNGAAPDTLYTFNVRVRADPDTNEVNNLYTNEIQNPLPIRAHQPFAVDVPVHDCTAGDCCGAGTWVTGNIGYEFDLDWYRYQHPCAGADCTVRVNYQVDAGPVDLVMNIFHGSTLWFTAFDIQEEPMQGGMSGSLGGMTAADSCFYAFNLHGPDYYIIARDLNELYPDGENIRPESKDFGSDQSYSFCVEKISNTCSIPPCSTNQAGCTAP